MRTQVIHSAHAKLDSLKLQMSSRGSDFKALVMTLPLRPQSVEEGGSRCDASPVPVPVPVVTEGVARRSAGVRLLRDNVVIHEGTLKTLKRFKDEVKEVQSGQECGMAFENYDDIRPGDVIEIFEREEVERSL